MHTVTRFAAVFSVAVAAGAGAAAVALAPARAVAQGRPMIEHIEPTSGPPGTRVQIVGRGFRPSARVMFNERPVAAVERLPERITVEVPPGAQSGRFVVVHGEDEVESREVFRIVAAGSPPRVSALEPQTAAPGMEVVVRGENFGPRPTDNQVQIGTLPMVVRSADPTALRVIVPEGASAGAITVRTSAGAGTSPAQLSIAARVTVREFTPAAVAPGARVTLRGSGFSTNAAQNRVTIGGRPARVVRATASELELEVPRDAQQGGAIVVEVPSAGRFETGAALRVAPAPAITAVTPPQGAPGARVTLRGERFGTDASAVRAALGQTNATVVSVAPGELVVQVPRGASSGRWGVTVGGIGPVQAAGDFTVLEPVTVTGMSPRAGDAGDRVTLTGTGFAATPEQNTVRLGDRVARVLSASPHELVVEVPQGRSGQWIVGVAGNGEARAPNPFMVTLRPRITALEPDRGVVGQRVTIRGQNFPAERALLQVHLGDEDCAVESAARDAIVVTVPRGLQPGAQRFSVIARLQGTGNAPMEYFVLVPSRITAVEPAAAPVGGRVTVRGEGFETDPRQLRVRLGALPLRPTSATTTAIEFVVPRGAQSGDLVVEAPQRQAATARFTVQAPPVVQTFAPAQGSPGTRVTLRGRNFGTEAAAVVVSLNEARCTVAQVAPDQLVVEVPANAQTGRFTVRVDGQGEARTPRDFRITTSRPAAP